MNNNEQTTEENNDYLILGLVSEKQEGDLYVDNFISQNDVTRVRRANTNNLCFER